MARCLFEVYSTSNTFHAPETRFILLDDFGCLFLSTWGSLSNDCSVIGICVLKISSVLDSLAIRGIGITALFIQKMIFHLHYPSFGDFLTTYY